MSSHARYLPLSQDQQQQDETTTTARASEIAPSGYSPSKPQVRAVRFVVRHAGLLLVVGAQFLFATMNLSVKVLKRMDPPTPTLQIITIRMIITTCCCMAYMVPNRIPAPFLGPKDVRGLMVIRSLGGFFGIFGMYYSLNYLSLADASVIMFLNPFTVALAAHLILGEAYTIREGLAAVVSLVGVVLIARPPFLFGSTIEGNDDRGNTTSVQRLIAVGSCLIGVCGNTTSYISMRAIGTRADPVHIVTFFSFWCAVVQSIAIVVLRQPVVLPVTWPRITLLLAVGLLGVVAQIMLTMGLRYETATRSSMSQFTQLFFVVMLELVVFGTLPSELSAAGAAVIVAAQMFAVLSKQKSSAKTKMSVASSSLSLDDDNDDDDDHEMEEMEEMEEMLVRA